MVLGEKRRARKQEREHDADIKRLRGETLRYYSKASFLLDEALTLLRRADTAEYGKSPQEKQALDEYLQKTRALREEASNNLIGISVTDARLRISPQIEEISSLLCIAQRDLESIVAPENWYPGSTPMDFGGGSPASRARNQDAHHQWREERGLPTDSGVNLGNENDRPYSPDQSQQDIELREQYTEFYLEYRAELEGKIKAAETDLATLEGVETLLQEDSDRVLRKDHVKCEDYLEEIQLFSTEVETLCTPIIRIDSEEGEDQEQERTNNGVAAARERFGL